MALYLLHGTLHCTIYSAQDLVDELRFSGQAPKLIRKMVERMEDTMKMGKGQSRIYATIELGKSTVGRTRIVDEDPVNPEWNEGFHIYCAYNVSQVIINVKCDDRVGAHVIGKARIPLSKILPGKAVEDWYDLILEGNEKKRGKIKVKLQFSSVEGDPFWGSGITGSNQTGVPFTFFPQRTGCRITLYQDAHMQPGFLPKIFLEGGMMREETRCWEDIYHAISNAKYLIYIAVPSTIPASRSIPVAFAKMTFVRQSLFGCLRNPCICDIGGSERSLQGCGLMGSCEHNSTKDSVQNLWLCSLKICPLNGITKSSRWSVHTAIRLIRDPHTDQGETLGELLKRKADHGCKVLLLVWDDRTSQRGMPNLGGIMGTHDEETLNYFKSSNVKCILCPRNPDSGLSVVQGMTVGTMFSHHQKTITVDAEVGVSNPYSRRIVSFVGGIDLCDGRYDDQNHSLFRTLTSAHNDDFYNGCFKGANIDYGGPREPWHDIHAKLEGPVAWDVLKNFEQRWKKQGEEGYLLEISDIVDIIPMSPITEGFDPETWNAQIFRSIDGGAAFGFPTDPYEAANVGLITGKDQVIERSIQDAYIHAIRRAKEFIYIENQYFLGSCATWDTMQDTGCNHLIPIELALKIVSKIEAGERFAVYIVIPMWPEGLPDSLSVQPILEWQRKTMEMMYRYISQALYAKGIYDVHPKDYLSFFCLGNRETKVDGEYKPVMAIPDTNLFSHYRKAQESRRFMIYVHSKMMIVDDEYIIIGSANINQRSMDGARDTEIAVGAYQPFHTAKDRSPRGQIHGFRMSLWYEHMGVLSNEFLHPNSTQCIRRVNEIGEQIWDKFIAEENPITRDLLGHLMTYPIDVKEDGSISEIEGEKWFPDTKAAVLGSRSPLPPVLTT
eukprot:Gb_16823 [translate_table: standard]